jgi:sterol desaturase/sphingolipid hydroxylase (fatty acid hydroxylase superfamily)
MRMLSSILFYSQIVGIYLISILLGWWIVNPIVRALTHHFLTKPFEGSKSNEKPTWWLQRFMGTTEQIIVTTSFLAGRFDAIGVWLLMKTAGAWSTQDKEAHPHALANDYTIFLIGTALSVGLSIGTAVLIQQLTPILQIY